MKPAPTPLEIAKRTVANLAQFATAERARVRRLEAAVGVLTGAVLYLLVRK